MVCGLDHSGSQPFVNVLHTVLIAERISARQLIRVHISANTYVREVTLTNFISHAQTSGSHA